MYNHLCNLYQVTTYNLSRTDCMKISLIFTPFLVEKNWAGLKAQERNIGIIPPLSLAYVAAIAERAGHEVQVIDMRAELLSLESTIERIRSFGSDIIGFTISTYNFHQTLDWVKKIKGRVNLPVLVGGWHLGLYPQETMTHQVIDYAVMGEADDVLPELLRHIERGESPDAVAGVCFRKDGKVICNPRSAEIPDINATPFPARHLLQNEKYYNILTTRRNFTVMLSTRGCPYRCIFCDLKTAKYRQRTPENFVDEIEQSYRKYGVREIDIYDTSFTANRKRAFAICEEIKRRKLDICWTVRTRCDLVDDELIEAMHSAGCNVVMYGIESAVPEILKNLRKGTDVGHIRRVVKRTRELGMKALGFFIIGSPGETEETAKKTIKFAIELDLDYVQFTRMMLMPNTELYEMYLKEGHSDYWAEYTLDKNNERELPLVGTDMTPEEAVKLVRKAYLRFYFRPKYIMRALWRLRSAREFFRSARAAWDILSSRQYS